ncbi:MAG: hypothetical protein M1830_000867 [Pleopsidium flavum]|nr:MAG: hypothetical protein M1830_000867 [Pleopsidium flavum]
MELPLFTSIRKTRAKQTQPQPSPKPSDTTLDPSTKPSPSPSPTPTNRLTRTRKTLTLLSTISFLLALPFLLLIELGSTHNAPVLRHIYFLKLDFSHIIPLSVPNAVLINSIARTLGLHDFYQVGLWNYCEGYDGSGITSCSRPTTGYWFNPVEILLDELLAGATIALPANITSALSLVRTASHWLSALFLTSTCLTFLSIPLTLLPLFPFFTHTRTYKHIPTTTTLLPFLPLLTALLTTAATVIATTMFTIFRNVFENVSQDVNVDARLGRAMFGFMWTAVGLEILGAGVQVGLWWCCCCCRGRRRRKRGLGKGEYNVGEGGEGGGKEEEVVEEKVATRRRLGFGRRKQW